MDPRVEVVDGQAIALVHDCNTLCGDGVTRLLPERSISLDSRWTVTGPDNAATLDPSIQCLACGLHGWWQAGAWVPA